MNKNSFLKVELLQQYDVLNQEYVEDRSIKIDINAVQHGILKEVGTSEFIILLAIASYMDKEGESFPSQRKLSEITGLSLPTVNKLVNKLLKIKVNGVPLLSRQFEQVGGRKKFSVYKLNVEKSEAEASSLKVEIGKEEPKKKKTAKDYAGHFCCLYEKEYGIKYIMNYARDLSLLKNKLMASFDEGTILAMMEYAIKNYRVKWGSANFPYPTIPMLCGWLGNAVMQQMKLEDENEAHREALEELTAQYLEEDYSAFDNILD